MKGLLRCARYAFSPNKFKYCGPSDKNFQLFSHIVEGVEDQGLEELLDDFSAMYPYLKLIAEQNNIEDPFDERVVEAYWIGNELLERVKVSSFWSYLMEEKGLKKRFKVKDLKWIMDKVPVGARVHHSFHVFNIWIKMGQKTHLEAVPTMDNCRISWGRIVDKANAGASGLSIKTQELVYEEGKLRLKEGVIKKISWRIGDKELIKGLKGGDLVTMHWGWVCEKVNKFQVRNLEYYTKWHLKLANMTI